MPSLASVRDARAAEALALRCLQRRIEHGATRARAWPRAPWLTYTDLRRRLLPVAIVEHLRWAPEDGCDHALPPRRPSTCRPLHAGRSLRWHDGPTSAQPQPQNQRRSSPGGRGTTSVRRRRLRFARPHAKRMRSPSIVARNCGRWLSSLSRARQSKPVDQYAHSSRT